MKTFHKPQRIHCEPKNIETLAYNWLILVLFLKRTFIARMDMKKLNSSGNVINRTILCREHQEDRLSVEFVSLNCEVKSF